MKAFSLGHTLPSVAVARRRDGQDQEPRRDGARRLPKAGNGHPYRTILLLTTVLVLTACASKLTQENLQKVHSGMTIDEVKAILGNPTDSQSADMLGFKSTSFTYHTKTADVKIVFLNDKVMSTEGEFK